MSLWVGVGGKSWRRGVARKYVPPGARAGAKGRGETMSSKRGKIVGKREIGMPL